MAKDEKSTKRACDMPRPPYTPRKRSRSSFVATSVELHLANQIPDETEAASAITKKHTTHKQNGVVRDLAYSQNTDSLTWKKNTILGKAPVHTVIRNSRSVSLG